MRVLAASTSVVLLVPVLLACGSSGGGSGSSGESAAPICKVNTVEIDGSIDGANANGMYAGPGNYEFSQIGTNSFTLGFGTSGALSLTWSNLVADDQSAPVTGTITMPTEGPHAGQVYCVQSGSIIPRSMSEGNGVSFSLTSLAKGACPGTAVSGSLEGCATPN